MDIITKKGFRYNLAKLDSTLDEFLFVKEFFNKNTKKKVIYEDIKSHQVKDFQIHKVWKSWGNLGEILGKSWGNLGEFLGNSWGNLGEILGKSWGNLGGKSWGNLGGNLEVLLGTLMFF